MGIWSHRQKHGKAFTSLKTHAKNIIDFENKKATVNKKN